MSEKKRTLEEQLKAKQRQLATEEDRIDEVCGSEDLHSFLSNLKTKIESAQVMCTTMVAYEKLFFLTEMIYIVVSERNFDFVRCYV